LNPQPLVLETSALPIELHPFDSGGTRGVTHDRTGNALNNQWPTKSNASLAIRITSVLPVFAWKS